MSRSVKKGPYAEERLMARIEAMNAAGEKKVVKTWSRATHYCGLRRKKTRSGIRNRRYGRLQARRVRAYENLQGTRGKDRQEVRR